MAEALVPRPYRSLQDFEAMRSILVAGRQAANGSYYVHVGDLSWWLFWPPRTEAQLAQAAFLWEVGSRVVGWSLLSPGDHWAFDLFVHPEVRSSAQAERMLVWTEEHLCALARERGGQQVNRMWVLEGDPVLAPLLAARGFVVREAHMLYLGRALGEAPPAPQLPEGAAVRAVASEHDSERRAAITHAAFGSSKPFDRYLAEYRQFMRSPVYPRGMDLVVVTPDGQGGACCIAWLDPVNRVGLFEPVATHPAFQGRGLGRAVLQEGLRRMRAAGMARACVCVEHDNRAARRLYEAVGFEVLGRLRTYSKPV